MGSRRSMPLRRCWKPMKRIFPCSQSTPISTGAFPISAFSSLARLASIIKSSFASAPQNLFYLNNLLVPSSVIFLDDYQIPGVRKAVAFFLSNMQWTMEENSEASATHQWAVVRTPHKPLERTFKDFVDF